jgi:hypothetical protein
MKVYAYLFGSKQDILNWVQSEPKLVIKNDPSWEYRRLFVKGIGVQFLIHQVHAQVFQLIPEIGDWKDVCKCIRRMIAAAPPTVKIVSRKWLKANYPNQFEKVFNPPVFDANGTIIGYDTSIERCPLALTGDNPSGILDYDPTPTDIELDIDPNPEDIGLPDEINNILRSNLLRTLVLRGGTR